MVWSPSSSRGGNPFYVLRQCHIVIFTAVWVHGKWWGFLRRQVLLFSLFFFYEASSSLLYRERKFVPKELGWDGLVYSTLAMFLSTE